MQTATLEAIGEAQGVLGLSLAERQNYLLAQLTANRSRANQEAQQRARVVAAPPAEASVEDWQANSRAVAQRVAFDKQSQAMSSLASRKAALEGELAGYATMAGPGGLGGLLAGGDGGGAAAAPTLPLGHAHLQAVLAELRAKLASLFVKSEEARLSQAGAAGLLERLRGEARDEERALRALGASVEAAEAAQRHTAAVAVEATRAAGAARGDLLRVRALVAQEAAESAEEGGARRAAVAERICYAQEVRGKRQERADTLAVMRGDLRAAEERALQARALTCERSSAGAREQVEQQRRKLEVYDTAWRALKERTGTSSAPAVGAALATQLEQHSTMLEAFRERGATIGALRARGEDVREALALLQCVEFPVAAGEAAGAGAARPAACGGGDALAAARAREADAVGLLAEVCTGVGHVCTQLSGLRAEAGLPSLPGAVPLAALPARLADCQRTLEAVTMRLAAYEAATGIVLDPLLPAAARPRAQGQGQGAPPAPPRPPSKALAPPAPQLPHSESAALAPTPRTLERLGFGGAAMEALLDSRGCALRGSARTSRAAAPCVPRSGGGGGGSPLRTVARLLAKAVPEKREGERAGDGEGASDGEGAGEGGGGGEDKEDGGRGGGGSALFISDLRVALKASSRAATVAAASKAAAAVQAKKGAAARRTGAKLP
jgi:hypothetical protein